MSESIIVDGVRYISTTEAAQRASLSADYITKFCRQEKIRATLVERNWFVDPDSLDTYLKAQNELKQLRSAALSAELRSVALRTSALPRETTSRPQAHSFLPPELTQPKRSLLPRNIVAATLALALTFGATASMYPQALAPLRNTITHLSLLANGIANLAAASEPLAASSDAEPPPGNVVPQIPVSQNLATSSYAAAPSSSGARTLVEQIEEQPIIEQVAGSEPLASASFVTQDELNSQLLQLSNALNTKLTAPATSSIPQNVAADGNSFIPYVPVVPPINNLSGVTITNANLTASEIPALNYFPATDTVSVSYGGTGLSSTPSYGQLLLGNGTGGYALVATSSLGIAGGAGNAGGADTQVQFNNNGSFQGSSSFTFASSTELLTVTNASTTNLFATNASTTNATSTDLFAAFGTFTTGVINALSGSTLTYTAASTTNISASGEGYFATASTTNLTISGSPSGFLQTNAQGIVSATSTFSANSLFGTLPVANGGIGTSTAPTYGQLLLGNGTGGYSLVATSSLGIAAGGGSSNVSTSSQNTWGALQLFEGNASTSEFTATSSVYFTSITNALLSTNQNGEVVATTSIGTNLLTGMLGTINGTSLSAGGSITVTAASSTLLANNNTFSGTNVFQRRHNAWQRDDQ